jgi:hypothetical protein
VRLESRIQPFSKEVATVSRTMYPNSLFVEYTFTNTPLALDLIVTAFVAIIVGICGQSPKLKFCTIILKAIVLMPEYLGSCGVQRARQCVLDNRLIETQSIMYDTLWFVLRRHVASHHVFEITCNYLCSKRMLLTKTMQ